MKILACGSLRLSYHFLIILRFLRSTLHMININRLPCAFPRLPEMGIFSESQKVNYTRMKEGWRTNYFVLNTIKAAFYPVTITS